MIKTVVFIFLFFPDFDHIIDGRLLERKYSASDLAIVFVVHIRNELWKANILYKILLSKVNCYFSDKLD